MARERELVANDRLLAGITECMLRAWLALWTDYKRLHTLLVQVDGRDELCRRYMGIPGSGPATALPFQAGVDDPRRFRRSKTVGAHFGRTLKREQSGTSVDRDGHISRCGDSDVRTALYEASSAMLTRSRKWSTLKAWDARGGQARPQARRCDGDEEARGNHAPHVAGRNRIPLLGGRAAAVRIR